MQPVLRCGRCNKPFDKQSTLKRHGYYCQSRKGVSTTRCRSCTSCAKRKARCDNKRPACSQCVARSIECHYPANVPRGIGGPPADQSSRDAPSQRPNQSPSVVTEPPSIPLDSALAISDPVASRSPADVYVGWDDPTIDLADFMHPRMNGDADMMSPALSTSLVCDWTPSFAAVSPPMARDSTSSAVQTVQPDHAVPSPVLSPVLSLPKQPSHIIGSALIQRPKPEARTQRTASLILHALKSFPLMMMRHNALPPFIHPHMMSQSVIENDVMEPLNNCISLLHMLSSRVTGSRKLFWRNVRMECERFCAEHPKWNKWGLLAALQALSVYLIIRLGEGQTENNDFDYPLVNAVAIIAVRLGQMKRTSNNSQELTWHDWIFEESRRRLCVIYQIVDMLVFFDPANMCHARQTQLLIAPLPGKKQLWEAGDEFSWKMESEKEAEARVDFALAANGELVKLHQSQHVDCYDVTQIGKPVDASRNTANWEEWCSGMDALGGLVMLAASMSA
ncbi:hypothetical protein VTI74DRAFT_5400 [Chaetomium olivicolor]